MAAGYSSLRVGAIWRTINVYVTCYGMGDTVCLARIPLVALFCSSITPALCGNYYLAPFLRSCLRFYPLVRSLLPLFLFTLFFLTLSHPRSLASRPSSVVHFDLHHTLVYPFFSSIFLVIQLIFRLSVHNNITHLHRINMRSVLYLALSALAAVAVADKPNPFNIPNQGYTFTVGEPTTLSWSPNTEGTVTLKLLTGAVTNPKDGTTIACEYRLFPPAINK